MSRTLHLQADFYALDGGPNVHDVRLIVRRPGGTEEEVETRKVREDTYEWALELDTMPERLLYTWTAVTEKGETLKLGGELTRGEAERLARKPFGKPEKGEERDEVS